MRLRFAHVFVAIAACAAFPAAAEQVEYTVLTLGKPSGQEVVEYTASGATSRYAYNDRGRGPELSSTWRVGADGRPVALDISGKGYFKTPVNETFSLGNDGTARWASGGERGSAPAGGALYLPLNAPPSYSALLATAVLRAPGQASAMLPAGRMAARQVATESLAMPSGAREEVRAIEVSGLGFEPDILWLDRHDRLFADVSGWFSVVRDGALAHVAHLLAVEERLQQVRGRETAARLRQAPTTPVLVHNARVFDPRTLQATPGTSVLVVGQRIAATGPDGSLHVPADARRIDAGGRFLMPGLWDNHVHVTGTDAILHLAAGVTTVRDMANDEQVLPGLVERIGAGTALGPRVVMSGFMDGEGKFAGPTRARVKSLADARRWIDWYADHGYVQLKVYSSLDPAWLPEIAQAAHARGLRLSGHVPAFMPAEQFIRAGADEVQHLNFVFLNFLFDRYPDTRDTTRFRAVGLHAAEITPEDPRVRALIALMASRQTVLDPTIAIFEDLFEGADERISPGYEGVVGRMPPAVARGMKGGNLPGSAEDKAKFATAMGALRRMLKALHDAKVPLLPGSDSWAGFGLHRELEVWAQAGIPNAEVLRAATLGSAQINRRPDLGVVAPGYYADFLLLDGDPLQAMSDVRKVRTVVKDGVWHDAAALYAAVGVAPAP